MMDSDDASLPLTLPDTQNAENVVLTQSQEVTSQKTPVIWGTMCPRRDHLSDLKMVKDVYTLGRAESCDIRLTDKQLTSKQLSIVSKTHFRISRTFINDVYVVYLEDLSYNGTFVNDVKVGKGNKVVLDTNDVISLAQANFIVYVYISNVALESEELPPELRRKYVVSKKLGSGACGEVKLVFTKDSRCQRFAMKTISKQSFPHSSGHNAMNEPNRIMNEVKILKALRHPYIIRTEEIIDTPKKLYIILELMEGGELFDRIRSYTNGLPEKCAKLIFYQVVLAVDYLHSNGITHRDLKPENILLASKDEMTLVKVSDFGLSKLVNTETMMRTFCGTPMYVAPEVLITHGRGTYTSQVDIWSLGVILYVSLTGHVPFVMGNHTITLQDQIINGEYRFPHSLFADISPRAMHLIKRMLTVDPNERITIKQVLLHPWLQDRNMRHKVAELRSGNNDENRQPPAAESLNNNNKHVFDRPPVYPKRTRHN